MREIALIGSTGSVGTQALDVVRENPEQFRVAALTAHKNLDLLLKQIEEFHPRAAGISDEQTYRTAKHIIHTDCELFGGENAHVEAMLASKADTSLISVVGFPGFAPLRESIIHGLKTCVANKESIVCGGAAITGLLKKYNARLYPVDSEHSAIFQCLEGNRDQKIRRILLTCSGGPFRTCKKEEIEKATVEQALKHPKWNMGQKISIDSATLANKGLEVLEARWLFDVPVEQVEVIVHPESIVHSMVEYQDRSVLAQMGVPDMKLPIQVALGYPQRLDNGPKAVDFLSLGQLHFEAPDTNRFPCLALAYEAGHRGGMSPIAFNAANELAVARYQAHKIGFYEIAKIIEKAMGKFSGGKEPSLDEILEIDRQVRLFVETI